MKGFSELLSVLLVLLGLKIFTSTPLIYETYLEVRSISSRTSKKAFTCNIRRTFLIPANVSACRFQLLLTKMLSNNFALYNILNLKSNQHEGICTNAKKGASSPVEELCGQRKFLNCHHGYILTSPNILAIVTQFQRIICGVQHCKWSIYM